MKLDRACFVNLAGAIVLIAGISMAFAIHRQAGGTPPDNEGVDDRPSAPLELRDSKRLSQEMERNWGSLGKWRSPSLGKMAANPQRLAFIVLGGSVLIGLGCFFLADRLDR